VIGERDFEEMIHDEVPKRIRRMFRFPEESVNEVTIEVEVFLNLKVYR
jgi:hypothetical protein